jgi:hypothetical protein
MSELPPLSVNSSLFATLGDPSSQGNSDSTDERSLYQSTLNRRTSSRSLPDKGYNVEYPNAHSESRSTAMSNVSLDSDLDEAREFLVDSYDIDPKEAEEINMWSKYNCGLYASYAAVGLSLGALTYPVGAACRSPDYFTAVLFQVCIHIIVLYLSMWFFN